MIRHHRSLAFIAILSLGASAAGCAAPVESSGPAAPEAVATDEAADTSDQAAASLDTIYEFTSDVVGDLPVAKSAFDMMLLIAGLMDADAAPKAGDLEDHMDAQLKQVQSQLISVLTRVEANDQHLTDLMGTVPVSGLRADSFYARKSVIENTPLSQLWKELALSNTLQWIYELSDSSYFRRTGGGADDPVTHGDWIYYISDTKPADEPGHPGMVFDHRIGLPLLTQAIVYRLSVLSVADPKFKTSMIAELSNPNGYVTTLDNVRKRIESNIRCGGPVSTSVSRGSDGKPHTWSPSIAIMCADVNTGISSTVHNANSSKAFFSLAEAQNWVAQQSRLLNDDALQELRRKIGSLELRRTVDNLKQIAHPAWPLIDWDMQWIRNGSGLCLDTAGGGVASGTNVVATNCTGSLSQQWTSTGGGQIINSKSGLCLHSTGTRTNSWVQARTCNKSDNQRWSFQPIKGTMTSMIGRVLDVASSGQAVVTDETGVASQSWGHNDD